MPTGAELELLGKLGIVTAALVVIVLGVRGKWLNPRELVTNDKFWSSIVAMKEAQLAALEKTWRERYDDMRTSKDAQLAERDAWIAEVKLDRDGWRAATRDALAVGGTLARTPVITSAKVG